MNSGLGRVARHRKPTPGRLSQQRRELALASLFLNTYPSQSNGGHRVAFPPEQRVKKVFSRAVLPCAKKTFLFPFLKELVAMYRFTLYNGDESVGPVDARGRKVYAASNARACDD